MDDMSLVYNINLCRICQIPSRFDLVDTTTLIIKGQTYLDHLRFIFNDITWIEDQLLSLTCQTCSMKIKDIAEFKRICLESNSRRGALNVGLIKFEIEEVEIDEILELKEVFDDYEYEKSQGGSEPEAKQDSLQESDTENNRRIVSKRRHSSDDSWEWDNHERTPKKLRNDSSMRLRNKKDKTQFDDDSEQDGMHSDRENETNLQSLECQICHMVFNRTRTLERHVYKHNGIRTHTCHDCNTKFITYDTLKNHQQNHCGSISDNKDSIDFEFEPKKRGPKARGRRFVCKFCQTVCAGRKNLDRHVYKHDGVRNYSCDGCSMMFITGDDLKYHAKKHCNKDKTGKKRGPKPKPPRFVCDFCQKTFDGVKSLERHVYRHNGVRNHLCNGCGTRFITFADLRGHSANYCNGIKKEKLSITGNHISRIRRKYTCELCPTDFDRLDKCERHMYQHNGVRKYQCNGCSTKFITHEDMKAHTRRHCADEKLACYLCPDKQFTPHTLDIHMKMIHMIGMDANSLEKDTRDGQTEAEVGAEDKAAKTDDVVEDQKTDDADVDNVKKAKVKTKKITDEGNNKTKELKTFKCHYCPMEFTRLKYLDRHVYNHDGTRNYICNDCGTRSITIDNLRSHMRIVHANKDDFKFLCTECGARFPQSSGLKVHVRRVHRNIRNFICDICNKAFCEKRDLINHLTSHSDVREFKCDLCPAEYKRKDVLLIHKTKRHGIGNYKCQDEKKHKCSFCDKKFNVRDKLNRHIRSHTGVKPFKCRLCDMKFVCKSYIKSHVMSKHSEIVDETEFDVNEYCEILDDLVSTNVTLLTKLK